MQVVPDGVDMADTAVHAAATSWHSNALRTIINSLPDHAAVAAILAKYNRKGLTPLHCALDFYHPPSSPIPPSVSPSVELLCRLHRDRGVSIDMHSGKDGATPLLLACRLTNTYAANLLIENGADVNAGNNRQETALMAAITAGSSDLVKLLIEKGADVNAATAWTSETALHCAVCERLQDEQALSFVRQLADAGADANAMDEEGKNPAVWAAELGKEDLVRPPPSPHAVSPRVMRLTS